jgi:hypothetical protein
MCTLRLYVPQHQKCASRLHIYQLSCCSYYKVVFYQRCMFLIAHVLQDCILSKLHVPLRHNASQRSMLPSTIFLKMAACSSRLHVSKDACSSGCLFTMAACSSRCMHCNNGCKFSCFPEIHGCTFLKTTCSQRLHVSKKACF